jgi:hypothetical protein
VPWLLAPQSVDFQAFERYPSGLGGGSAPPGISLACPESNGAQGDEGHMTTFEERQKGFERKFALDEELKFKAMARRNRLLGLWAAEQMGITGDDAANYAREVVKADLAEPGDEDVFRKIRADFDAKGVGQSDHQIRRMMTDFMVEAIGQIESEAKG